MSSSIENKYSYNCSNEEDESKTNETEAKLQDN